MNTAMLIVVTLAAAAGLLIAVLMIAHLAWDLLVSSLSGQLR